MNVDHLLIDSLEYKTITGRNNYGDPSYGAATTLACRIEKKRGIVQGTNGEQIEYSTKIATKSEIPPDSLVFFDGASSSDANQARRPVATRTAQTLNGSYRFYESYYK